MAVQHFKSKIDLWILLLLVGVIIVDTVVIISIAMQPGDPVEATITILACIAAMVLIGVLLTRTYYTVDKGVLRVIAGPFRWRVQIEEITSVTPTRSPLSSPALSLDRLLIKYGKRRRIMVSPADKSGFLRAIGQEHE